MFIVLKINLDIIAFFRCYKSSINIIIFITRGYSLSASRAKPPTPSSAYGLIVVHCMKSGLVVEMVTMEIKLSWLHLKKES